MPYGLLAPPLLAALEGEPLSARKGPSSPPSAAIDLPSGAAATIVGPHGRQAARHSQGSDSRQLEQG